MKDIKNFSGSVKILAEKYAQNLNKQLDQVIEANEHQPNSLIEINDGIKILNHLGSILERIDRLETESDKSKLTVTNYYTNYDN